MDVKYSEPFDIDRADELWKLIKLSLFFPPFIALAPKVDRGADEIQRYAIGLCPTLVREIGGEAGKGQLAGEKL